ncbi:MAG: hypothetical protein FWD58_02160 [Firmicutes bacterium]|nr:hypothetical protein [Bacillota bacterium]
MYGLVKTMDDGQGGKIKLVGNALTFIIYKNYFGRDLLNDIVNFAKSNADTGTVKRLGALNVRSVEDFRDLSESDQTVLFSAVGDFRFDTEFTLNFIAALMATARYPEKPDVTDIIVEIPPHWIADSKIIAELMEFLSLFISAKKAAGNGGGL